MLIVFALAFQSAIAYSNSPEEVVKTLSLFSFALAIAAAEPRLKWPAILRRPLAGGMTIAGFGLMGFWILAFGFRPSFEFAALSLAFVLALREVKKMFPSGVAN